jgi:hypothetical protein
MERAPTEVIEPSSGAKDAAAVAVASLEAAAASRNATQNLERYRKMRNMLPEAAVRQRMQTDGMSQEDIDNFFMD